MKSAEGILSLLQQVKPVRQGQWMALCPAHADKSPSLSITAKQDAILLYCFAGCKTDAILGALKINPADLFFKESKKDLFQRKIKCVYDYVDAKGKPFQVVRTEPKGFYQRRPDGKGGYINNLDGIIPALYHSDMLAKAKEQSQMVCVVEGEKDADNVISKLGFVATTSPMGAGKWHSRYADDLAGLVLVIMPDNDEVGKKHALQIAQSCHAKSKRIWVLNMPEDIKDISNWIEQGGDAEKFRELLKSSTEYTPETTDKVFGDITSTDRHYQCPKCGLTTEWSRVFAQLLRDTGNAQKKTTSKNTKKGSRRTVEAVEIIDG